MYHVNVMQIDQCVGKVAEKYLFWVGHIDKHIILLGTVPVTVPLIEFLAEVKPAVCVRNSWGDWSIFFSLHKIMCIVVKMVGFFYLFVAFFDMIQTIQLRNVLQNFVDGQFYRWQIENEGAANVATVNRHLIVYPLKNLLKAMFENETNYPSSFILANYNFPPSSHPVYCL